MVKEVAWISDAEARRHVWAACALVMGREGETVERRWSQALRTYLLPLYAAHPSGVVQLTALVPLLKDASYGPALELALAWWSSLGSGQ